jgi:hypothetical protein
VPHERKLGLDFGGVVRQIDRTGEVEGIVDGWSFLKTPPVPVAFSSIRILKEEIFQSNIWIVSRCGSRVADLSRIWLRQRQFSESTNVPRTHFLPCEERKDKVRTCQELGITDFVDNRLEVLSYMIGIIPHLYLFQPTSEEVELFPDALPDVHRVENWPSLVRKIRSSFR